MKNMTKVLVTGLAVTSLVFMGCEPGDGSDADATATTGGGTTDGSTTGDTTGDDGGTTSDDGGVTDSFAVLEIEDDPANETLDPCDTGTLKSPGADIDAAELMDSESNILANLTNCELQNVTGCESTASNAADAEGAPNSEGKEATGEYVALNGGLLRCAWSDDQEAMSGDIIQVFEVGGSASTKVEQYTVRVCKSAGGNCTQNANYASGDANFPVDTLL